MGGGGKESIEKRAGGGGVMTTLPLPLPSRHVVWNCINKSPSDFIIVRIDRLVMINGEA